MNHPTGRISYLVLNGHIDMYMYMYMYMHLLELPSNQSFYSQIASYGTSVHVGDHRVAKR